MIIRESTLQRASVPRREAIYHHLDRNGDGSLECGEFKDIVRGRLRITKFDLDEDGLERLVNPSTRTAPGTSTGRAARVAGARGGLRR